MDELTDVTGNPLTEECLENLSNNREEDDE